MKQGTAVHKVLEEEVHVTVPVSITKREDSWGLRVWNIIQGLRTLRETGRTREFEVWGTVGGELVNGVIDELSYDCPDPKLEEQSLKLMGKQDNEPPMPEYQASIREYLVSSEHREQGQSLADALNGNNTQEIKPTGNSNPDKRIYITDVKTRGVSSLPTGSSLRPTIVQLHLYHHLLENFAQGNFPLERLATRFKFDVNEPFSDSFIAQIGNLNQEAFNRVNSSREDDMEIDFNEDDFVPSTQDSIDIILQYNNMSSLWQYMLSQFQETFIVRSAASSTHVTQDINSISQSGQEPPTSTPQSISSLDFPPQSTLPTLLSPLLTAQYLSSKLKSPSAPSKPRLLGSKSIIFNPSFLRSYLYDSLAFWRGEREPKGVVLSDAWKCRVCEFRDECDWVKEQDERVLKESMERRRIREEGAGDGMVGDEVTRSHV
jgi:exonuclease V